MRAAQDPNNIVTFCISKVGIDESTLLEIAMKTIMAGTNVRVTSFRVDRPNNLLTMLEAAMLNTHGDFYVDEAILPGPEDHSTFTSSLQHLVSSLSPGRRLWLGVAGVQNSQDQHLDQSYLQNLLSPLYLPDMRTPLRSCRNLFI